MTNGTGNDTNLEEITLAIALLAGVIAVLLKISDFFNNNVIPPDADLRGIASFLVTILLIELLIIPLFILFKGISIYAEPDSSKANLKIITQALFKLSFIYFFLWLIALILTFIFTNIIYYYNIKSSNDFGIFFIYQLFLFILLIIVGLVLWDYRIFHILYGKRYLFGEFWKRNRRLFLFIGIFIVLVFLYLFFVSLYNLLSLYLLMGSYSIGEFSQPNNDNITIGIKETGVMYNTNYISLFKMDMDSDFPQNIDVIKMTYNQINFSRKGFMVGTNNDQLDIWYLSINTSKLQPGNYLLHAEVTIFKSPALGTVKKHADKLFYIAPNSTKYSFNSTPGFKNTSPSS